jgi:hypothetical protein
MSIELDDLATEVSDVAHVLEESYSYFLTAPAVKSGINTETAWLPIGHVIYELYEAGAFREHASVLHAEIRRAAKRNARAPVSDLALVAWDECVTYFARKAGVFIPSGRAPQVEEQYPEKRWFPAMPAVIQELRRLATELADHHANSSSRRDGNSRQRKQRPATVNERMLRMIQKDVWMVAGWSASDWAKALGCAKSTVCESEAWKQLGKARSDARRIRAKDRRWR